MVKGGVWLKSGDIDIQILEPITDVQSYGVDELTDLLFQIVNEQLTT
jgi:hypothetical protein